MKTKIKLGADEIKSMTLFENLTGARVKDCVQEGNSMGFLVEKGDMGLAIGKNGANIMKVRKVIGKPIYLMEFFENQDKFIKKLFQPIDIKNAMVYDVKNEKVGVVEIKKRDNSKVVGRGGRRIKIARKLAQRHFGITNIKVKLV